jgi:hypothetical protein
MTIFQTVFERWTWKPIRNCPGRYIFAEGVSRLSVEELVGRGLPVFEFASEIVPDRMLVMKFDDGGGIISYKKERGCLLHTLNDTEGFTRKIGQLRLEV